MDVLLVLVLGGFLFVLIGYANSRKGGVRQIVGNLAWLLDGRVLAVYHVDPIDYAFRSDEEKITRHRMVTDLVAALPRRSRIYSVCDALDPDAVHDATLAGVDPDLVHPGYHEMADGWLDWLETHELYRRLSYVVIELPDDGIDRLRRAGAGAVSWFSGLMGGPPVPVRAEELADRSARARTCLQQMKLSALRVRPAHAGEIDWLEKRHPCRGHVHEPRLDPGWEPPNRTMRGARGEVIVSPSLATRVREIIKEGGSAEDPDRPPNPFQRQYLRVRTPFGEGYQVSLVWSQMPKRFWFPGGLGEAFVRADSVPFPVDYCVDIHAVDNEAARSAAKRSDRTVGGQFEEWEDDPSGAPQEVYDAKEASTHERDTLAANPAERELQTLITFTTWSTRQDPKETLDQARAIQRIYRAAEYELSIPTGDQDKLYEWTKLSGRADRGLAREFTQYLLTRDLAALMPFVDVEVGDPTGTLIGYTLAGGTCKPVFVDLRRAPVELDASGCAYFSGVLGQGKSYLQKLLMAAELERGDTRAFTFDRTKDGEYVRFAESLTCPTRVVSATDERAGAICIDPMRVFGGHARVTHTRDYLILLCQASPQEPDGRAIGAAVREAAREPEATIRDVVDKLDELAAADLPGARTVVQALASHVGDMGGGFAGEGENPLVRLVFGDGEVLDLDGGTDGPAYVVLHAPYLQLPRKSDRANSHRARQIPLPKLQGEALFHLGLMIGKEFINQGLERGLFGILHTDELAEFIRSDVGRAEYEQYVRDSRKERKILMSGSQLDDDAALALTDEEGDIRALLGWRFAGRQDDASQAARTIRNMGRKPTGELVEFVQSLNRWDDDELTGLNDEERRNLPRVFLVRDPQDRVGPVVLLPAPTDRLHRGLETNLDRRRAYDTEDAPADDAGSELGGGPVRYA
ncbi:MAG: ATP-binding protein [Acidimicrobiia bacterium]|nr:ATP-binding protein [Acidimicrobiia bacterium]